MDEHIDDEPASFAMSFHSRADLPVRAIAEQIACRRKALKKLPDLSKHDILYTKLSLEQASGERTAKYKSELEEMAGNTMLDMTGGLGIDACFFSRRFQKVVFIERDTVLAEMASGNFREFGIENIAVLQGDSVEMLESCAEDTFDLIYIDPARREKGKRSVALESSSPDVVALHDLLIRKAGRICVKASPALETSRLIDMLPSLYRILVLSVDGECKEVLLFCSKERVSASVEVEAVCLGDGVEAIIRSSEKGGKPKTIAETIGDYLYEPDPAIIKAGLTPVLAEQHALQFVNPTLDYLTSNKEIERFPAERSQSSQSCPTNPGK